MVTTMTNDPLIATYMSVGWPATWDVRLTIALARCVEERVARLPWGKWPEIVGAHDSGDALLVYSEQKPAITAEEVIDNLGIVLRVPMQGAHQ